MHGQELSAVVLSGPAPAVGAPLGLFHFESHAAAFRDQMNARWTAMIDRLADNAPDDEILIFAKRAGIPLAQLASPDLSAYRFVSHKIAVAPSADQAMEDFNHSPSHNMHSPEPAAAVPATLARDANRWRALMSSQRFKLMGSAGFEYEKIDEAGDRTFVNLRPIPQKEHLHFGIEVWNTHAAHGDPRYPDRFERDLLTVYVDTLIARGQTPL